MYTAIGLTEGESQFRYRLGRNAGKKYTRSDHRVGEHIADTPTRNAKKSRAAKPGNKTED